MSYSTTVYLICRKRKYRSLGVRITSRPPTLEPGEVPIYLKLDLPDQLFDKPTLRAEVKVDQAQVPPATVIAKVADNIAEQLRAALGVDVRITVEPPPQVEKAE